MCGLGLDSLYHHTNKDTCSECDAESQPRPSPPMSIVSFMTFVKFTSSLISLLQGAVLSENRTCSSAPRALSALAPRMEWVLSALVYVFCPQLVSLLVVFTCLSQQSTAARCHIHVVSAKKQQSRCCHSFAVALLGDVSKVGRMCGLVCCVLNEKEPEEVKLWILPPLYYKWLYCNTDKPKHPSGSTLGNANTPLWMCVSVCEQSQALSYFSFNWALQKALKTLTHTRTHTCRVKPGGCISAWPGVPSAAARRTTCRSQVWPSPGKRTTQLLLQPLGDKKGNGRFI